MHYINPARSALVQSQPCKSHASLSIRQFLLNNHLCFTILRTKKMFNKHPSADNVSDTSVTDESLSTMTRVPQVREQPLTSVIYTSLSPALNNKWMRLNDNRAIVLFAFLAYHAPPCKSNFKNVKFHFDHDHTLPELLLYNSASAYLINCESAGLLHGRRK